MRFRDIAAFCVIMPYIGYGGLPTDVQPLALALSFLCLVPVVLTGKLHSPAGTVFLVMALVFATFGFFLGVPISERDLFYDARAFYGYLTALIIFVFFWHYLQVSAPKTVKRVLDVALAIIYFGFLLNILGQTQIIQAVVSRAEFEWFQDQGRGLTSFFPEQSRLANQMILMLACYAAVGLLDYPRIALCLALGALSAAGQFFVNFSVLIASLVVSFLIATGVSSRLRGRLLLLIGAVSAVMVVFTYSIFNYAENMIAMGFPVRGISAFREILSFDLHSFGTDIGFLFKISGPAQVYAVVTTSPLALELGLSYYFEVFPEYVRAYEGLLYDIFRATASPYPPRAYSVFGAWGTDLSAIGVFLSIAFFWMQFRAVRKCKGRAQFTLQAFLLTGAFLFLTRSNNSDPTIWATFAAIQAGAAIAIWKERMSQKNAMYRQDSQVDRYQPQPVHRPGQPDFTNHGQHYARKPFE